MIRVDGLEKRYGRLHVLKGLDLEVEPGKVTAILGPNAAGKTTLIKSVLGLVRPDAGDILIGGEPIDEAGEYRRRIGYMPQIPRYPENLKVREILEMIRDLRHEHEDLDDELIERFELGREMEKSFKNLSGGTRQKVSAVIAFRFRPDLLILDEPTAGLDPLASSHLKDKIAKERANGRTIILTSHIMAEIEELADRVVYLIEGKIQLDGTLADLVRESGEVNLERAIARLMRRAA